MNASIDISPAQEIKAKTHSDSQITVGYTVLGLSFLIYLLTETIEGGSRGDLFAIFIVHYFFALGYGIFLIFKSSFGIVRSWKKEHISKTIILLHLFLISAYALNRELPVFEDSAPWLCLYLIAVSVALLSFHYSANAPRWINRLQQVALGFTFSLYIYMTLYVATFYPFGVLGTIVFGIGAHIFVPLTFVIACIVLMVNLYREKRLSYSSLAIGFATPLTVVVLFTVVWTYRNNNLERYTNQSVMYKSELPSWVKIAQIIPNDWITERLLKSGLVYSTHHGFNEWTFLPDLRGWEEEKKHDPLVYLASINGTPNISFEERIRILTALYDSRHYANERLWTGEMLTTSYIISDIDIYADLRLAYTEKYFTIKNNDRRDNWSGNPEEAIYTFQLPEGSVVTSLSLWINGKEEKAILTSKQKAAQAYQTIVGVEARDPSVVQWQEGNTVTVRVFPCTNKEDRKFKIGITSPLMQSEDKITYNDVIFRGPATEKTKETIRIRMHGNVPGSEPKEFRKDKHGDYVLEKYHDGNFQLSFMKVPLKANNRFTFQGHTYSLTEYTPTVKKKQFSKVYLDVNNSWTHSEIEAMASLVAAREVFVYDEEKCIRLSPQNQGILDQLASNNFSVFPFHRLSEAENALVITKGKPLSPHLGDFKESEFASSLSSFMASGTRVHVFNLGNHTSTYIRSMRELRAIQYAHGSTHQLLTLLSKNEFPQTIEGEEDIVLHDSGMKISKRKASGIPEDNNAPDHLARLFAYNHIMRKLGPDYFSNDYIREDLVREASTAYVVSPVSSLIVLESTTDYQRFNIADNADSLKNASKDSSGAVPEPHEWVLIILFLLLVVYLRCNNVKARPV